MLAGSLGACTFTQKIQSGKDAFTAKQYAVAVPMLEDEYAASQRPEDRATRAFMLGQCYEEMRQPDKAAPWYKKAFDDNYGTKALEHYADMLRQSEQYSEAITVYQQLMSGGADAQQYRGDITLCNQAIQWKKDAPTNPYKVKATDFNTADAEYAPYVLGPDVLLFTSDRQPSTGNGVYKWTGRNFSDLYSVNLSTGVVQPFEHALNTQYNEGTVAMTSDRSEMYFIRCFPDNEYDSHCKLMTCHLRGASWSEPEVLPFVKKGVNYDNPVIAGSDSLLIFSSDDPLGMGGYDLYYSLRSDTGWTSPVPLSARINTIGNERFPSVYNDTLYFSSDDHAGLGGYDIFKTYLDARREWTPPINLKAPINSGWDDFGFVVDTFSKPEGDILERGYFASSRNAKDGDDIFSYEKVRPTPPPPEVTAEEKPLPTQSHLYLAIKTMEPVFATPGDPNSARIGKRPLPETVLEVSEGMTMRREKTDQTGLLILDVPLNKSYTIKAHKAGYLNQYRAVNNKGTGKAIFRDRCHRRW